MGLNQDKFSVFFCGLTVLSLLLSILLLTVSVACLIGELESEQVNSFLVYSVI